MPMYPGQIDDNISMPSVIDNKTHLNADIYNRLRNAIIAVEQELGVKPSGIYTTVKSRIDNIENNNVYREVTHSPNNPTILTPTFVGERVLDSTHGFWYTALYNDSTSSRWSCDTVKSIRAQLSDGSITFDVTNFPALLIGQWIQNILYKLLARQMKHLCVRQI